MRRGGIFVLGTLSGALALGLLLLGWNRWVAVAPVPAPTATALPPPAGGAPAAPAAVPRVDLPSPALPQAGSEPMATPRPAVVVAPPSSPELGELPADEAAVPVPEAPMSGPAPTLSLIIPVDGISAAQLSDTFTDARGESRVHDAIDIMAATGTPVRAVADGRIVKLFNSQAGGLTLYQFDATGSVSFYYAHLDRYADGVAEGQPVQQGDLLGYVGYTGNASPDGPHLHFAVTLLGADRNWWQGTAINPYPYLRQAASR